ncbi:M28 family peptidase [Candidatus Contubernalis alkaliaceticus]|uniref:M28 family peptidase n=1 Tax=Candidatus Contubernalis alkaliaceticus TaxID=338645 RepID=UPI001F4C513B|nr:M28 family peptidase [Candidatus Contubernalis alkalaceticus]UNC91145.1 M28 family peptidase [Candidatus Contubernalis alkalaceticus]
MYMNHDKYVEYCVNRLSVEIGARPAGSQANRRAADFIGGEMKQAGYQVVEQKYPCPDWQAVSGELTVAGKKVPLVINTFSPSCDMEAELVPVTSVEELQNLDLTGRIAVIHGEITATSFMPKNFDRRLYMDENKDRFIELLEKGRPAAVITVSHYDIPLPVIEDSELDIPSVTVYRDEGKFVVESAGEKARLKIVTRRRAGTGSNVIGRWGQGGKKILLCAHYDTKPGTPGAMDNASGVAALLLLAWQLRKLKTKAAVELVAFGGEDSWFPGDALYIQEFPPDDLAAAINIDGVGAVNASTTMAIFGCSDELTARISQTAKAYGDFVQGPFYESDHGFFWPLRIPTLAFTSMCMELLGRVTHTENDTIDLLDTRKIEQTAGLVLEIVHMLTSSADN